MSAKQKRSLAWVLGVVLLAAAGVGAVYDRGNDPLLGPRAPADAPPPAPAAADDQGRVVCFGHVDVEFGVRSLHPLRQGRVAEVLVPEYAAVKKGDPILRLDDRQERALVE